jgi:hypothetical protein
VEVVVKLVHLTPQRQRALDLLVFCFTTWNPRDYINKASTEFLQTLQLSLGWTSHIIAHLMAGEKRIVF